MSFGYKILGFGSGGAGATPVNADYLIIAGGGSGGSYGGTGAGGAGGMRYSYCNGCASTLEIAAGCTSITVGDGGAATIAGCPPNAAEAGDDSILPGAAVTITSAGGGYGAYASYVPPSPGTGGDGGSGGGGKYAPGSGGPGGSGNTPAAPTALGGPQGRDGGNGQGVPANFTSGGGGGHGSTLCGSATGGAGTASCITASTVTYAGGGGGGQGFNGASRASGGAGGGGTGGINNYGGRPNCVSMAGLNRPVAGPVARPVGTNAIATSGADTIFKFTVSGTLTL